MSIWNSFNKKLLESTVAVGGWRGNSKSADWQEGEKALVRGGLI